MTTIKTTAPAKVNLTLHVTGQRSDGYHLVDSLVVFASVADELTATTATSLRLKVSGAFSPGVPNDQRNLIWRAAELIRQRHGITLGAEIKVKKHLPHAAGIGGGSSDAAATLQMLAKLWGIPAPDPGDGDALALGADVPVCLHAPKPVHMSGIGEVLQQAPKLPRCGIVLARPDVSVPTAQVFARMSEKTGTPMDPIPGNLDFAAFCKWLQAQRNDLLLPASAIAPQIGHVLDRLRSQTAVGFAGMSGSGATCFALVKDIATARQVARVVQVAEMGWWVAPGEVL